MPARIVPDWVICRSRAQKEEGLQEYFITEEPVQTVRRCLLTVPPAPMPLQKEGVAHEAGAVDPIYDMMSTRSGFMQGGWYD
jgi:hypothetical protein